MNPDVDTALRPIVPPLPAPVRLPDGRPDPAQDFVDRLRAAAPRFAVAAGVDTAVVREVVPPARHRRARCRVVLRTTDGSERDLSFLGPVSRAAARADRAFESSIRQWLGTPQGDEGAGLVSDDEAPGGYAVDLTAWSAPATVASPPTTAMPVASGTGHPGVPTARAADLPTEAIAVPAAG